jgi:hypothetical protein
MSISAADQVVRLDFGLARAEPAGWRWRQGCIATRWLGPDTPAGTRRDLSGVAFGTALWRRRFWRVAFETALLVVPRGTVKVAGIFMGKRK